MPKWNEVIHGRILQNGYLTRRQFCTQRGAVEEIMNHTFLDRKINLRDVS